jgi:hypothetical protein
MLCVFPIHAWALLMGFRDFSWVALRTSVWDALGLLSYSSVFALLETTGIFLILVVCGFLIPNQIDLEKRLAFVGTSYLIIAIWAILGQLYSMLGYALPGWFINFLVSTDHPFRYLWGIVFLLVTVSVSAPLVLIARREKFRKMIVESFDRVSTVSSLYIFFDLIGIVIIVIRNLHF